jgi:hypothetical protein
LHGEIALLVEAGLTPLKALAAATSAPAAAFRLTDRGRIAPGKRADLLLVDGNPGVDIRATRNIVSVWKQGRSFDREAFRASLPAFKVPQSASDLDFWTIGDFDNGTLLTQLGTSWQSFDHVTMKLITPGANGSRGALAMFGEVRPNRPAYLWPGIVFFPSGVPRRAMDFSSKKGLIFWARGDGKPYRVVLTTFGGPREKVFTPGPTWQPYSYPFTDFGGFTGFGLLSIIFAASSQSGGFELQLDEVAFK